MCFCSILLLYDVFYRFRDAYGRIRMHMDAYGCMQKHNGCIRTWLQAPWYVFRKKRCFYGSPAKMAITIRAVPKFRTQ